MNGTTITIREHMDQRRKQFMPENWTVCLLKISAENKVSITKSGQTNLIQCIMIRSNVDIR